MVHHLPRDSAVARAVHGDSAEWGLGDYLLAAILDAENAGVWQRANANAPKHQRTKPPAPVARPGIRAKSDGMSDDELRGRLLEFKARTAS